MATYAMADTHLSSVSGKPMDRFGARWQNYTEKLVSRWRAVVGEDDTVVIPGDISWAMKPEEARDDLLLLDSLPGKKLIGKGNHDYWWQSPGKVRSLLSSIGAESISVLSGNAFVADGCVVCGSRGWFIEEKFQSTPSPTDYEKLVRREVLRINASLEYGRGLLAERGISLPMYVFLHFPPVFGDFVCRPIVDCLKSAGIGRCFYGHIHGKYLLPPSFDYEGIKMEIISSDYLDFYPKKVSP